MTIKGGAHQACAVCKYQRRRCTQECLLAPYFPGDQQKIFQNAHRLFGVKNITNILKQVPDSLRDEAMRSIKYQSDIRARFPSHGCLGVISQLRLQIHQMMEELMYLRAQIDKIKSQNSELLVTPQQYQYPLQQHLLTSDKTLPLPPYQTCSVSGSPNGFLEVGSTQHPLGEILVYQTCSVSPNDFLEVGSTQHPPPGSDILVEGSTGNDNNNHRLNTSEMRTQSPLFIPQGCPIQQENEESEEAYIPYFDADAADEESEEAWKSCAESSWKRSRKAELS